MDDNLKKQQHEALKELEENKNLVKRNADQGSILLQSHLYASTGLARPTRSWSCSWWRLCYVSKRTCGQVLVLPSRCLVLPAADDDFNILLLMEKD